MTIPEQVFGIPYEYFIMFLALFMAWNSFKAKHNKILARASALSFLYTLFLPLIYSFELVAENEYLKYSWGTCFAVFMLGGTAWMILELSGKSPFAFLKNTTEE